MVWFKLDYEQQIRAKYMIVIDDDGDMMMTIIIIVVVCY